jgi:hypothetical protein
VPNQGFFYNTRLSIRSIENSPRSWIFFNKSSYFVRLVSLARTFVDLYFVSFHLLCPHTFIERGSVIFYYYIRSIDDIGGGAIILLQLDDFSFWEIFFEMNNIFDVCSSPRVNTLPIVPYNTEILRLTGEKLYDFVLN